MTNRILALIFVSLGICASSFARADHAHHPKHNMVLFGEGEAYYASHIVYKTPHNYQVIIKLNLETSLRDTLASEAKAHPGDAIIYLLDSMDISQIHRQPVISGQIFRKSSDGSKHVIAERVVLQPTEYSIVYFSEVPLNLGSDQ